jgi:hypothetical protein
LPAGVELGRAFCAGAGEHARQPRQALHPALHGVGVVDAGLDVAAARCLRNAAFHLRAAARQYQTELAAGGLLGHAHLQLAVDAGALGLDAQRAQVEHLVFPLALGHSAVEREAGQGLAARAALGAQCGVEGDGAVDLLGLERAAHGRARQLGVQRAGPHAAHGGLGLPGRGRGAPLAGRVDAPAARAHGGFWKCPMGAVEADLGLHLLHGQLLFVPRAGQGVADVGRCLPRGGAGVGVGLQLDAAGELRLRRAGPQARRIDVAQVGLGVDHRLRQPGRDLRLHLGLHGGVGVLLGGLQLGGHLQPRAGARERALDGGGGQHVDVVVLGQRRLHAAVERGVDRHGRGPLQLHAGAVVAVGNVHALDLQRMLGGLVEGVGARQVQRLQHGRAGPAHFVDAKRQLDLHGQHDLLQRLHGLGAGRAAFLDQHLLRMHLAELHLALEQRRQLPADGGVVDLDRHALALVLEPADVAAGAQRAGHVAALQRLAGGQPLRGLREREGQRLVGAQVPPRARGQQQHHEQQAGDGPGQRACGAARASGERRTAGGTGAGVASGWARALGVSASFCIEGIRR